MLLCIWRNCGLSLNIFCLVFLFHPFKCPSDWLYTQHDAFSWRWLCSDPWLVSSPLTRYCVWTMNWGFTICGGNQGAEGICLNQSGRSQGECVLHCPHVPRRPLYPREVVPHFYLKRADHLGMSYSRPPLERCRAQCGCRFCSGHPGRKNGKRLGFPWKSL